jgi:hypothetical protein
MIYFTAITNYMLLEHDSSPHQRQYPTLPYILTVFMMIITTIYYKFQHLYSVFLAIYFTSLGYYILRTYRIIFLQRSGDIPTMKMFDPAEKQNANTNLFDTGIESFERSENIA